MYTKFSTNDDFLSMFRGKTIGIDKSFEIEVFLDHEYIMSVDHHNAWTTMEHTV